MSLGIRTSAFTRAASATCLAAGLAVGILAGSMSASAAPVDCATLGATTIAPGICQILVTTSGTFTAPSGVSHLEALLVSGGSAGQDGGYAGGVGAGVMYVDTLPVDGPLTFTIGAGGVYGVSDATGTGYGTGATGDGVEPLATSLYGISGVLPSSFVAGVNPASTLFPAYAGEAPLAGDGQQGDDDVDGTEPIPASQTPAGGGTGGAFVSALPNSGSGGGGRTFGGPTGGTDPGNGGSGLIILRFAAPEAAVSPALAATGTDSAAAVGAAGVLLLGGAVALTATGAKRRRSARA